MTPVVSVIIPAFQALGTIDRAVASIQTAGLPLSEVQIIITPYDGQSYEFLNTQYKNITIVASDTIQSGAGPTRNRALRQQKAIILPSWMPTTLGRKIISPQFCHWHKTLELRSDPHLFWNGGEKSCDCQQAMRNQRFHALISPALVPAFILWSHAHRPARL